MPDSTCQRESVRPASPLARPDTSQGASPLARHKLSQRQSTCQTKPESERQPIGQTKPESESQLTRGMQWKSKQYVVRRQPTNPQCKHPGLAVSATNHHAWSVRCDACDLKLSVWWQSKQDYCLTKEERVKIVRKIASDKDQ